MHNHLGAVLKTNLFLIIVIFRWSISDKRKSTLSYNLKSSFCGMAFCNITFDHFFFIYHCGKSDLNSCSQLLQKPSLSKLDVVTVSYDTDLMISAVTHEASAL